MNIRLRFGDGKKVSILHCGKVKLKLSYSNLICMLKFSSCTCFNEQTIVGSKVASATGNSTRIFHGEFRPDSDNHFVTVGVKHVKFWTIAGGDMVGKRGVIQSLPDGPDDPKMQTMLSVAFGAVSLFL